MHPKHGKWSLGFVILLGFLGIPAVITDLAPEAEAQKTPVSKARHELRDTRHRERHDRHESRHRERHTQRETRHQRNEIRRVEHNWRK